MIDGNETKNLKIELHFYFYELILSKLCLCIYLFFSVSPNLQDIPVFPSLFNILPYFHKTGICLHFSCSLFTWGFDFSSLFFCLFVFEMKTFSVYNIFNILCSSEILMLVGKDWFHLVFFLDHYSPIYLFFMKVH